MSTALATIEFNQVYPEFGQGPWEAATAAVEWMIRPLLDAGWHLMAVEFTVDPPLPNAQSTHTRPHVHGKVTVGLSPAF